ncbi:hypothetical protein [Salisediminibacterium halotolerans]|uniref:hypothetical protein n=1 Tax=Salisediminibacterium halotolerans TaxID=517425 RepID=UPI001315A985|nr:hypothetical protein [Salisediminibacterium halotolerans]
MEKALHADDMSRINDTFPRIEGLLFRIYEEDSGFWVQVNTILKPKTQLLTPYAFVSKRSLLLLRLSQ